MGGSVRRFVYASGSSDKFWSVGRDGTTVTVHFGRVGTDGQTQVRELTSENEAEAHVTKLVAQKLKKGYAEDTVAVVGAAPVAVVEPVRSSADEDTLVLPEKLWDLVHPRRGGRFAPPLDADPARAWQLVDDVRDTIVQVVERGGGNADPGNALAYLTDRTGEPYDAAVVATIVEWALDDAGEAGEAVVIVDAWVADHGLAFAARAVMAREALMISYKALNKRPVTTQWSGVPRGTISPLVGRLRAHLAAATDDEHAAAVTALEDHRGSDHELLVTAFLVPARADWVTAANTALPEITPLLIEAIDDLDQLAGHDVHPYDVTRADTTPLTLLDGIGTGIAPFLAAQYDAGAGIYGDTVKPVLATLAVIPTDEAFDLLLRRVTKRWVRPFLQEAMDRFPVRAARRLAATTGNPTAQELFRAHATTHRDLLANADLPDAVRARLAQVPEPLPEATNLPALLVDPPWTRKSVAAKTVVVTGLTSDVRPEVVWLPGERDEWARPRGWRRKEVWHQGKQDPDDVLKRFRSGRLGWEARVFLATGPEDLARQAVRDWAPEPSWEIGDWLPRIAARFEFDAVPALLHLIRHGGAADAAEALLPFGTTEVAAAMADAFVRLKTARQAAGAWLDRHADVAAHALVPAALGKPGKERRTAEAVLRVLDPAMVAKAAAAYGTQAADGIAAVLAADPLDVLPARIPKVPAWLDIASLSQLVLRDGGALPHQAVANVVTMLALSKPDDLYAGVDMVKQLCTPDSLAGFAWSVFGAWQSADMPAKDGWALTALGWLGNDDTVRGLTPLIRAWPGESGHSRAVVGLDVLAAIGTDVALTHLNGIAQKVKFTGLRNKAKEKITQVAAELRLTPDQLADRLVPDLGLDDDGSMVLDYGPRRFVVGFDERLVPYVLDESGTRRKDLPKPGARDDGERAPAAHQRFTTLKKDVRTLAADQVGRLQQAMVDGRRWSTTEFTDLFVGHPLMRHLARRLVWAHVDGDTPVLTFRVAEDRTLAGVTDDEVTLPTDATIGIPHPLHLGDELAEWGEIFADYEILQPFPQLGRPVHALTDEERDATELAMFTGITMPTGKVLGLTNRGWRRGDPQDNGVEGWILRPLPDGRAVVANLDPGITVGMVDMFPEQKFEHVWLSETGDGDWWPRDSAVPFDDLDPVTASEVLTELIELTGTAR